MCKIMEEYAKEYAEDVAIDTTIETALKYNATKEQIVQDLVEKYGLDSASAQKRIEEFINLNYSPKLGE
uniref:hypothetical protein n=1 Tax=Eubacterium cellulosolvens TaxID=29322 RepID=UPI000489BC93|nr:hypothetical protein [[Eubacterium] cellulosolvens]